MFRKAKKKKSSKSGGLKKGMEDLSGEQWRATFRFFGAGGHESGSGIRNLWALGVEQPMLMLSWTSRGASVRGLEVEPEAVRGLSWGGSFLVLFCRNKRLLYWVFILFPSAGAIWEIEGLLPGPVPVLANECIRRGFEERPSCCVCHLFEIYSMFRKRSVIHLPKKNLTKQN